MKTQYNPTFCIGLDYFLELTDGARPETAPIEKSDFRYRFTYGEDGTVFGAPELKPAWRIIDTREKTA